MYKAIKNFSCGAGNFNIGDEVKEEMFKEHKDEFTHIKKHGHIKSLKDLEKEAKTASDKIINPGKRDDDKNSDK